MFRYLIESFLCLFTFWSSVKSGFHIISPFSCAFLLMDSKSLGAVGWSSNTLSCISESCTQYQNVLNALSRCVSSLLYYPLSCCVNALLCYSCSISVCKTLFLVFPTVHVINSQKELIEFSLKILSWQVLRCPHLFFLLCFLTLKVKARARIKYLW